MSAPSGLIALLTTRTSSPFARQSSRQRSFGFLPASSPVASLPCGSPDADDAGCVRPTSASHHSVNEYPRLVGSRSALGLTLARPEGGVLHGNPARFGGPLALFRPGALSSPAPRRRDRTSDTPSLTGFPRDRVALFLRRTTPLPAGLDRFVRLPRDGTAAPSTRGAFHRQVPVPSTRAPFPTPSHDPCFPRSRGFAHRDPVLDRPFARDGRASRFRDRRRPTAR